MGITYYYKCDTCGHDYTEMREEDHPLWFPNCVVAGCSGTNEEVK